MEFGYSLRLLATIGIFSLSTVGCTVNLGASQAEAMIRSSAFMTENSISKLVLYENKLFPESDLRAEHPDMDGFVDLGLVDIAPSSVFFGKPVGAKFILSPKGQRAAASGWSRTAGPRGEEAWFVVTARKEFLRITGIESSAEVAEVAFEWKWIPTELGSLARLPDVVQKSTAVIRRQGDQWSVANVSTR